MLHKILCVVIGLVVIATSPIWVFLLAFYLCGKAALQLLLEGKLHD